LLPSTQDPPVRRQYEAAARKRSGDQSLSHECRGEAAFALRILGWSLAVLGDLGRDRPF
jgi:hypothetical protein